MENGVAKVKVHGSDGAGAYFKRNGRDRDGAIGRAGVSHVPTAEAIRNTEENMKRNRSNKAQVRSFSVPDQ